MDLNTSARLTDGERETVIDDLNSRIMELRSQRAVQMAAHAASLVRQVCPETALVLFEGPQEPGSTATILRLVAADGHVIYDCEDEAVADDFEDDLTPAQDFLTGALEDNSNVCALGLGGAYLLPVPRA